VFQQRAQAGEVVCSARAGFGLAPQDKQIADLFGIAWAYLGKRWVSVLHDLSRHWLNIG
jgi:hypothetical protein